MKIIPGHNRRRGGYEELARGSDTRRLLEFLLYHALSDALAAQL